MTTPASQSVGLVTGVRPAGAIFGDLVAEAREVLGSAFGVGASGSFTHR